MFVTIIIGVISFARKKKHSFVKEENYTGGGGAFLKNMFTIPRKVVRQVIEV